MLGTESSFDRRLEGAASNMGYDTSTITYSIRRGLNALDKNPEKKFDLELALSEKGISYENLQKPQLTPEESLSEIAGYQAPTDASLYGDKFALQLKDQGELTPEVLDQRTKELSSKPVLDFVDLRESMGKYATPPEFKWIPVNKLAGRAILFDDGLGWASENSDRKGRMKVVARELASSPSNPRAIEHIFHPNQPNERIKSHEIEGPAGPMYFIYTGQHRVGGVMLAGLSQIPSDVEKTIYPYEKSTDDLTQVANWEHLIELGLLEGEIQTTQGKDGQERKTLVVKKEELPWITSNPGRLSKISSTYERLYPGSLDNLKIPKEALLNTEANKYYMSGRWSEWLKLKERVPQANN